MNFSIELPDLTWPLEIDYGRDAEGQPVTVVLNWAPNALKRGQLAAFAAYEQQEMRNIANAALEEMRDHNAILSAIYHPENLPPEDQPKSRRSKTKLDEHTPHPDSVRRLGGLAEGMGVLQDDIKRLTELRTEANPEAAPLYTEFAESMLARIQAVDNILETLTEHSAPTDAEIDLASTRARERQAKRRDAENDLYADMVAHLCRTVEIRVGVGPDYASSKSAPVSREVLQSIFSTEQLKEAKEKIQEAMRAPLRIRGNSSA